MCAPGSGPFFESSRGPARKGRRSEPGRKKFAPPDGGIRARREWGANLGPGDRPQRGATPHRAGKSLLPWTEK